MQKWVLSTNFYTNLLYSLINGKIIRVPKNLTFLPSTSKCCDNTQFPNNCFKIFYGSISTWFVCIFIYMFICLESCFKEKKLLTWKGDLGKSLSSFAWGSSGRVKLGEFSPFTSPPTVKWCKRRCEVYCTIVRGTEIRCAQADIALTLETGGHWLSYLIHKVLLTAHPWVGQASL